MSPAPEGEDAQESTLVRVLVAAARDPEYLTFVVAANTAPDRPLDADILRMGALGNVLHALHAIGRSDAAAARTALDATRDLLRQPSAQVAEAGNAPLSTPKG